MQEIISGAGLFIYPLALCSFVGVFIIIERSLALRRGRILPPSSLLRIERREKSDPRDRSTLGNLGRHAENHPDDDDGLRAMAALEVNKMERGLVFLEIIIGAAPLLGLLGTVTGLIQVFANISPDTGLPEPRAFVEGVALALTTTVLGLSIAIPCLVANGYFQRKVDTFSVQLAAVVEQIQGRHRQK